MKKLVKIFKIFGISLFSLIVAGFFVVWMHSQIGNSSIKADIEGLGTQIISINTSSLDRTESQLKFGFCLNDKIRVKTSVDQTSRVNILFLSELFHHNSFRSKRLDTYLKPDEELIINQMIPNPILKECMELKHGPPGLSWILRE